MRSGRVVDWEAGFPWFLLNVASMTLPLCRLRAKCGDTTSKVSSRTSLLHLFYLRWKQTVEPLFVFYSFTNVHQFLMEPSFRSALGFTLEPHQQQQHSGYWY
ncbi:unnamed protein product [Schistocephalus solidus]|uniref:Secreted protein n=1 Tax=Schistocephalus solidus TaxID=70667 RepID=A0A183SAV4_SCHSO|nr:unnamed protein product [Schistocephalus solidus]